MKFSLLTLFLFFCSSLFAQTPADSLYAVWKDEIQHDTIRFKAFKSFIWENYLFSNPDTAYILAKEQLNFADKKKNTFWKTDAYNTMGITWYFRADFDSAIFQYEKGLNIAKQTGNFKSASGILNNIGTIEMARGNYAVAIEKFNQSLKIEELKGNKLGAANCFNNIGIIYYRQKDYDRARHYYLQAVKLYHEGGNDAKQANTLNNLGVMENELKNSEAAIEYHILAYEIRKKNKDQFGIGASLNNLATVYMDVADFEKALPLFFEAIEIASAIQDLTTISAAKNNIAHIYLEQNKISESIQLAEDAYQTALLIGAIGELKNATEFLYRAYKEKYEFAKALEMHELFMELTDSMSSEENQNEIIRQEYKASYEKIAVADSLKALEEKKLQVAEIETINLKNKQRNQFSFFVTAGLIAALIVGFIIYKRLRITREQKKIIEDQQIKVLHAYDQLEEKNKEILDSITYAKRIQSAILPPQKIIRQLLKNSFILYKPKDIVAGDFYWLEHVRKADGQEIILFAAADCTGHGVPGALVSVVCHNALNRSVREFGLTEPGKILDKTREIVIQEFEKSDDEVKDGMDISLCAFSPSNNLLQWSGANNPIWIISKNSNQIQDIKPDKQPIGRFANASPFQTHSIALKPNDTIYLFTDGFQDQFGGDKGKKFKASSLKELILGIQNQPMNEQHDVLEKSLNNWRGSLEQIDDVCLIGVRFETNN